MSRRCLACGATELPGESRFCLHCGSALGPLDAPAPAGAPSYTPQHLRDVVERVVAREGERKHVTVLIADVAGSLAMAHRLDPEDLHALMDGFFALALDAVHAEHGFLNQYRGDGFMALFGAPSARPGHELHAVRAALALRRQAESYSGSVRARFGVPLVLRMGVHSGSAWVGAIGAELRRDYTAEGPIAGLAVRLEQAAGPGQILVSAEVAERVRGAIELRALGALEARGAPEPLQAFEVVGPAAWSSSRELEPASGRLPFAGRAVEISRLAARLEGGTQGGALWIEIVGEAGIGKSRLATELRARDGGAWLEGRARELQGAHAYALWLDVIGRWIEAKWAPEDASSLVAVLEGREGPREPEAVERALRALLEAAPGPGPLSIAIEDAHWIDVSSLRLARALLARPPARGIRFLVTARPEGLPLLDPPGPSERLALGPLDREHAAALALAVLADRAEPEPLAALAAARGEGNPLFVIELARALREGDDDLRDAARFEAAWRRSPARLPATLRDVIAARLDALDDGARRVLQIATVVGRSFALDLIEQLAAGEVEEIGACSARLLDRGLLQESGDQLDFAHALHREVAYEQMLHSRRRELHRRCASVLAAAGDPPTPARAAEIGLHYDRAGELGRAARAYARAGDGHLALFAAREGVAQLRRAWEIAAEAPAAVPAPLRIAVGLDLARGLNLLDRSQEAGAVLESMSAEDVAGEDRARLAEAWIESAWVRFCDAGEGARSLALLERGLAAAADGQARGRNLEARAHAYRIRICHLDGAIAPATESARRVVELATASGERFGVVFGIGNEGYVRCDAGDVEAAHRLCAEAYALAREARHEVALAFAAAWLAKAHVFRGDCDAALRAAAEARELGLRSGQASAVYNADAWTGMAFLLQNEPKRAAESLERLASTNARWPTTLDWLAVARLEIGHFEEAAEMANRCLATAPPRLVRLRALRTLGLALGLAQTSDRESAERALSESVTLATELQLLPHLADAHLALAELCRRGRDERRAEYYAERARRTFEACGMPLHAALAHAERGRS